MTYPTIAPRAINKVVILGFPGRLCGVGRIVKCLADAKIRVSADFRHIAAGGASVSEPYTNAIAGDRCGCPADSFLDHPCTEYGESVGQYCENDNYRQWPCRLVSRHLCSESQSAANPL